MRWICIIGIACLISFASAQKFDTTNALTLDVTPSVTASCGGCKFDIGDFQLNWYSQAYTHVAATIVKIVNNATNTTRTSTILGSNFTIPASAAGDAVTVSDSVITTTIGGTLYTLTYPNEYRGIHSINKYSQSPIVIGNRTIKCVVSKTALTHAFILREYISNGLEESAFFGPNDKDCEGSRASPPQVLVRVSSLTATTTNYVDGPEATSSAVENASPSIPLKPPVVPRTTSARLSNHPTVLANSPPRSTANPASIATRSAPPEPISSQPTDSVSLSTTSSNLKIIPISKTSSTASISKAKLPSPVNPQQSSNGAPGSQAFLMFTPSQPESSQAPKNAVSSVRVDSPVPQTIPSSESVKSDSRPAQLSTNLVVVGGLTIIPGFSSTTSMQGVETSGTHVSLGKSGIPVSTGTIPFGNPAVSSTPPDRPSTFFFAGTTLTQGGSVLIVSGADASLSPSISVESTLKLPSLVLVKHTRTITTKPLGLFIAGTFVTRGALTTISGTPVSLGSSELVIGTQTVFLPSRPPSSIFSVGDQIITASPTGFLIHGTTILPNSPAVTISGTPVYLGASGLVIGTQTIALAPISGTPVFLGSSAIVNGSNTVVPASVTDGVGPAILSGLGFSATPTFPAGAGNGSEPFPGAQTRFEVPGILLVSWLWLVVMVWAGIGYR